MGKIAAFFERLALRLASENRAAKARNHRTGPGKRNSVTVVLEGPARVVKTVGRIDGMVHEAEISRGFDKRTHYATTRPDPGMGKAEWWAVKTGRKPLRRAA